MSLFLKIIIPLFVILAIIVGVVKYRQLHDVYIEPQDDSEQVEPQVTASTTVEEDTNTIDAHIQATDQQSSAVEAFQ
jgi:hypothetical protein